MNDSPPRDLPPAVMSAEEVEKLARFRSLRGIRRMLEKVARAVLVGKLDHRLGNTAILAATQASRTFALEDELAERAQKRREGLTDEQIREALDRMRSERADELKKAHARLQHEKAEREKWGLS